MIGIFLVLLEEEAEERRGKVAKETIDHRGEGGRRRVKLV